MPCFPCPRYSQWQRAKNLVPHLNEVSANLEQLRRGGAEAWLRAQQIRWACPDCGARFSWYAGVLPAMRTGARRPCPSHEGTAVAGVPARVSVALPEGTQAPRACGVALATDILRTSATTGSLCSCRGCQLRATSPTITRMVAHTPIHREHLRAQRMSRETRGVGWKCRRRPPCSVLEFAAG